MVRGTKVETFALNFDTETQRRAETSVARTMTRLDLPPGRYQIRVIADRVEPSGAGSVYYDVDVPDFSRGALSMSGVVLTSMAASHFPTLQADAALAAVLPAPPVGARAFRMGESLAIYAEVYDNVAATHEVEMAMRITSASDVVREQKDTRPSTARDARRAFRYLETVNLEGLAAGSYVLTLEAQDPARPGSAVSRRIPFEVVTP
jgi:hypothetical protein